MSLDVLVLGGGPAGAAAAVTCRCAGLSTGLVTREAAFAGGRDAGPRPIESLHPGVEPLLEHLGAGAVLRATGLATYDGIVTGAVVRPLGPDPGQRWRGTHVRRPNFDAALLDHARACGVEVRYATRAVGVLMEGSRPDGVVMAGGERLRARWLVDATGRAGILGRWLGFERELHSPRLTAWTGALRAKAGSPGQACPRFIPRSDGWTWLTEPVCGEVTWTWLAAAGSPRRSVPLPAEVAPAELGRASARPVQWRVVRPLVLPGVILVGEAAAVLDPACGQGVLNSLYSGILGARAIVQSVHDPAGEAWYLAGYDQWLVDRFHTQAQSLRAFYETSGIHVLKGNAVVAERP